jgi:hypothetical protein
MNFLLSFRVVTFMMRMLFNVAASKIFLILTDMAHFIQWERPPRSHPYATFTILKHTI